jgi:hypothetical protein
MTFDIRPYEGAGKLYFGMTSVEVRKVLGEPSNTFFKTSSDTLETERYEHDNLFIYYKEPSNIEAIEFYSPSQVIFDGIKLFELSYEALKTLLLKLDSELEIEVDGLTSYKLGIGAYAPNADEDGSLAVESIIIFEKGYYEE